MPFSRRQIFQSQTPLSHMKDDSSFLRQESRQYAKYRHGVQLSSWLHEVDEGTQVAEPRFLYRFSCFLLGTKFFLKMIHHMTY